MNNDSIDERRIESAGPKHAPDRTVIDLPKYKVMLHNDEVNDMAHVVKALMIVFKYKENKAEQIMQEAHNHGVALCSIEQLEVAELRGELLRACSLVSSIEPA